MSELKFNNLSTGLDLLNAQFLVKAADLVYEDLNQIQTIIAQSLSLVNYKSFDIRDTQAFLAANNEIIVLAFRGTTSINDWRTDFRVKLIPVISGLVHRGFNEALDYIWKDLKQAILNFKDKEQSIWITGHSLGGALATLVADRLTNDSMEVKGVYTFGQPRVGNKVFANNYDGKMKEYTFRFVHDEDMVAKIPSFLQGYNHIGTECYFDREGTLYTDKIRLRKFISRCTSVAMRSSENASELSAQNPGGIRDHGLGYYERCIRENYIKEKGGPETFQEYINS